MNPPPPLTADCPVLPVLYVVDGWTYCGWIPFEIPDFEDLKAKALKSDHGEERKVVERSDGSGVNCFYREASSPRLELWMLWHSDEGRYCGPYFSVGEAEYELDAILQNLESDREEWMIVKYGEQSRELRVLTMEFEDDDEEDGQLPPPPENDK